MGYLADDERFVRDSVAARSSSEASSFSEALIFFKQHEERVLVEDALVVILVLDSWSVLLLELSLESAQLTAVIFRQASFLISFSTSR